MYFWVETSMLNTHTGMPNKTSHRKAQTFPYNWTNYTYQITETCTHTHIPHQANFSLTSPDITFCSPNIAPSITWKTETDLSSDHLPIIATLRTTLDTFSHTKHTITNYKRAAWDEFLVDTEAHFQELNLTHISSSQILNNTTSQANDIINNADKSHIPKGNRKHYNPYFTPDISRLIRERNNLRRTPTPHTRITTNRIHELSTEINTRLDAKWFTIRRLWISQKPLSSLMLNGSQ